MKIHMGNIGMTLHIIHKLRAQGIDNVQVNMDWQHLIMNGENLAEYAALLADEGLLGHQHGNSGWGTFDDDNMVGATAFMETLELARRAAARELRRATASGSASTSTRTPRTRSAAVERSVLQWRFIDGVAGADRRRGAARGAVAQGRGARLRARLRGAGARPRERRGRARRRHLGASRRSRSREDGEVVGRAELEYRALHAAAGLGRAGPGGLVARDAGGARAARRRRGGRDRAVGPDARARRARRRRAGAAPGDPVERPAHGRRVRGDRAADRARAADRGDRQPRADRLHRAEAAVAASSTSPRSTSGSRTSCCRRTTCGCSCAASARSTSPTRRARCCSTSRTGRWSDEVLRGARACPRSGCRARSSRPRCRARRATASRSPPAPATRPPARSASGSTHAGEPLSVVLGTSGVVFAALPRVRGRPRGARARVLPRGAGDAGTRWA